MILKQKHFRDRDESKREEISRCNCPQNAGFDRLWTRKNRVYGEPAMQRAVKHRLHTQEQYRKRIHFSLCAAGRKRANICIWVWESCEASMLHLKLNLTPVNGSQCPAVATTAHVGAPPCLYRSWLKRLQRRNIEKKASAKRTQKWAPQLHKQRRRRNRFAPPLMRLRPYTQPAAGSDHKLRLHQQGILRTISE